MKTIIKTLFFLFPAFCSFSQELFHPELRPYLDEADAPFYFGVASGDPHPDGVVIWTKIFPATAGQQEVAWEVAADTAMLGVVQRGTFQTNAASAYTVKVEVKNLLPGTVYFYRFSNGGTYSPIGRTRTAPAGDPGLLRLAVVSCADYQSGHYNAFGDIARRSDLDAVVHLGDYIYEYGVWRGGRRRMMKSRLREHIPDKVCTDLKDYRTRYAQYRTDPQLMEAHRLHPFIVIWDDHEVANDSHVAGTAAKPDGGESLEMQ